MDAFGTENRSKNQQARPAASLSKMPASSDASAVCSVTGGTSGGLGHHYAWCNVATHCGGGM